MSCEEVPRSRIEQILESVAKAYNHGMDDMEANIQVATETAPLPEELVACIHYLLLRQEVEE